MAHGLSNPPTTPRSLARFGQELSKIAWTFPIDQQGALIGALYTYKKGAEYQAQQGKLTYQQLQELTAVSQERQKRQEADGNRRIMQRGGSLTATHLRNAVLVRNTHAKSRKYDIPLQFLVEKFGELGI